MTKVRDEATRIADALRGIGGATVVTTWPKAPETSPVILLTLAGERGADRRDDREYLTEHEYYVRVFSAKAADMCRVCAAVHEIMHDLGYERTFRWEEPSDGWRQTAARYKTYR